MERYQLFVDLDGVLVDFDSGVKRATGREPGELHPRQMWPILAKTPGFYDQLEWMHDGRQLWDAVSEYDPVILTGLPLGKWAEGQKRSWCARELGDHVPVITGMSRKKADLARDWLEEQDFDHKIPLLVDDRLKIRDKWEDSGGTFILHLSTDRSLEALRNLGYGV